MYRHKDEFTKLENKVSSLERTIQNQVSFIESINKDIKKLKSEPPKPPRLKVTTAVVDLFVFTFVFLTIGLNAWAFWSMIQSVK